MDRIEGGQQRGSVAPMRGHPNAHADNSGLDLREGNLRRPLQTRLKAPAEPAKSWPLFGPPCYFFGQATFVGIYARNTNSLVSGRPDTRPSRPEMI